QEKLFPTAECRLEPLWPLREPLQQRPVDPARPAGAVALRPEKALLMVAEDRVGVPVSEDLHDLIRETVFVDAVAEADELVDIAEDFQCPEQAGPVAVHIRDDADFHAALRQAMIFIGFRLMATSPRWFSTSTSVRTMPRSGLERDRVAPRTVTRTRSTSPGRTGSSQRNSSMPGEARLAPLGRKLSASSRIIRAAVCQPLAINPPNRPLAAFSGSTCMS